MHGQRFGDLLGTCSLNPLLATISNSIVFAHVMWVGSLREDARGLCFGTKFRLRNRERCREFCKTVSGTPSIDTSTIVHVCLVVRARTVYFL